MEHVAKEADVLAAAAPDDHRGSHDAPPTSASAGASTKRLDSVREELGALGAVDRAVVARERHRQRRRDVELAVDDERAILDRADREDRDLRRVEDGDELLDAVHPEVRDRERAALEVRELELAVARARDEVGAHGRDLLDRLAGRRRG